MYTYHSGLLTPWYLCVSGRYFHYVSCNYSVWQASVHPTPVTFYATRYLCEIHTSKRLNPTSALAKLEYGFRKWASDIGQRQ